MRSLKFVLAACFIIVALFVFVKNLKADNPITIWWPKNNVNVDGIQPFKALSEGRELANYQMFWQVDGGALNTMNNNFTDYPHKEARVDLANWNWNKNGIYEITFVAKDNNDTEIGNSKVSINIPQTVNQINETPLATNIPLPQLSPQPTNIPETINTSGLFVDPQNKTVVSETFLQQKIETQPQAEWFGGWNSDVKNDVKNYTLKSNYAHKIPVLVTYNIPNRDCKGYSKGGSADSASYENWINSFADGISGEAIVILEPDSVALIDCLNTSDRNIRFNLLSKAVQILKNRGAKVYIDAGHPGWHSSDEMVSRLQKANIAASDGFSLNVANFISTTQNINYGREISVKLNNKHFIIDTSRNGINPTNNEWCNPTGMALGEIPTINTGLDLVDGYLWIKRPGESDGNCNGGPSAGTFWPEYANGLAKRASW